MKIEVSTNSGPIQLEGRLAAAISFLLEHAAEIQAIPCGRVVLHFKGKNVVPEVSRSYRPVRDEPQEE